MRKITADYIFPISSEPIKNGIIILDENGVIIDLIDPLQIDYLIDDLELYKGFICPGFINTHCHLELSHLKGKIAKKSGLNNFIKEIQQIRAQPEDEILQAIKNAEDEMLAAGIVAVGDISNGLSTIAQKKLNRLKYHTFIELFAFNPERADDVFEKGKQLHEKFNEVGQSVSLSPHAPYSVSAKLLHKIANFARSHNSILSIHNQETGDENQLFKFKEGKIIERLNDFGVDTSFFVATGLNSLESSVKYLPQENKIQLVHNTFTIDSDVEWTKKFSDNIYWCFCPNANLFIESTTPNFELFKGEKITIGTDSLASNDCLSVLEELKIISLADSTITLSNLLEWGTLNGAIFLGFDEYLGSIEIGKKPGLNLIENVDVDTLRLRKGSFVNVL